jgi:tripartite-type tricarboxylate transporter receptor subunit TctC
MLTGKGIRHRRVLRSCNLCAGAFVRRLCTTRLETESQMQAGTARVIAATSPRLSDAQIAFCERALSAVDQDEGWRADLEKNQLSPAFTTGRETRKYRDNLDGPLKATLGDPGLLR